MHGPLKRKQNRREREEKEERKETANWRRPTLLYACTCTKYIRSTRSTEFALSRRWLGMLVLTVAFGVRRGYYKYPLTVYGLLRRINCCILRTTVGVRSANKSCRAASPGFTSSSMPVISGEGRSDAVGEKAGSKRKYFVRVLVTEYGVLRTSCARQKTQQMIARRQPETTERPLC